MTILDLFLTVFALISAITVLQFCVKNLNLARAGFGITVAVLTILYCGLPVYRWYEMRNAQNGEVNALPVNTGSESTLAKGLPTVWSKFSLELDLAVPGLSIENAIKESEKSNRILVLLAERGILPEYESWVKKEFGSYKVTTEKNLSICFHRLAEFPYSSGICQPRSPRLLFDTSTFAYASVQNGEGASVLLKRIDNSRVAISTMPLENSPEEYCLKQLSQGSACAVVEVIPGGALSALFLDSQNSDQKMVMDEFHVPTGAPAEMAHVDPKKSMACGGLDESKGSMWVIEDKPLQTALEKVNSEIELSDAIRKTDELLSCAGPSFLRVPAFNFKKVQPATRSFLAQLLEYPFWLTTPESYLERVKHIKGLKVTSDVQVFHVNSKDEIRKLAVTVLTPVTFNEELLHYLHLDVRRNEFRAFRTGPTAFRIVSDVSSEVPFDLQTAAVLNASSSKSSSSVTDWSGFNRALLFALALALFVSWLQSVATVKSEHRAFTPLTFFYIGIIGLIWSFLSYRASLQGGQGSLAETQLERHAENQYATFRDWNESWWKPIEEVKETKIAVSAAQTASWRAEVAAAKKKAGEAELVSDQMKALDLAQGMHAKFSKRVNLILWDAPEIRNWYFRKSPAYASTVTAWQSLYQTIGFYGETKTDPVLAFDSLPKETIVIVPDLGLLSQASLAALSKWVNSGGTVVYHWNLDPLLSNRPQSAFNFPASDWKRLEYSKLSSSFEGLLEVNRPHWVNLKTKTWYSITPLGSGRFVYSGVMPVQANASHLEQELLHGLNDSEAEINVYQSKCSTALLIQPYGVEHTYFQGLAQKLKASNVPFSWALDAESFARMAPEWKSSFTAKNVVFIDDGKPVSRFYADELYKRFFKTSESPLFVSLDANQKTEGPKSVVLRADLLPASEAREISIPIWKSECMTGVARPRLMVAQELKTHLPFWQAEIPLMGAGSFETVSDLFLHTAPLMPTPSRGKLRSKYLTPLQFQIERTAP